MGEVKRYSPEVRERAIRMVVDHRGEYPSQWAVIESVPSKLGMTAETLRHWVRRAEIDTGARAGITTDAKARMRELELENEELWTSQRDSESDLGFFATELNGGIRKTRRK